MVRIIFLIIKSTLSDASVELCSAGNAKLKLDPVSTRLTPRVGGGPEGGPGGSRRGGGPRFVVTLFKP